MRFPDSWSHGVQPEDPRHVICQHIVQLQLEHLSKQGQGALPMLTSQAPRCTGGERFATQLEDLEVDQVHHTISQKIQKSLQILWISPNCAQIVLHTLTKWPISQAFIARLQEKASGGKTSEAPNGEVNSDVKSKALEAHGECHGEWRGPDPLQAWKFAVGMAGYGWLNMLNPWNNDEIMMNNADTVANLQKKSRPAFEEHQCVLPVFLRLWMCQKKKTKFVRRVWSRETLLVTLWHTSNDGRLTSHCRIPKFHWRPVKAPSPSGLRHDSPCSESKVRPWHSFCTSLLNMISRLQRNPKKDQRRYTRCQAENKVNARCHWLAWTTEINWNLAHKWQNDAKSSSGFKIDKLTMYQHHATSFNIIQHV